MVDPDGELRDKLQTDVPHAARMWNYRMGGKDNFQADRAAGDAVAGVYPEIAVMARESRKFLIRVVRHLAAEAGIRQFVDVGTGLPTMQNTHEVVEGADKLAQSGGVPYVLRSPDDLAACFEGLTLVEPGLVPIPLWRPDEPDPVAIDAYGAVARRP
ncbi:SAM-dependent methyltransferase [Phytohabitans sp. ZYX-F-186]|uniref:SAM-dependent methyltransferase n=1 Tax=Phytohabitans maris TaxID=3071409 RepID=A0ABU0ZDC8_9ACTN|nr:SAM-dependent methyltransferase [Phytohabitans sp. ZYX-F-186]MDQ7904973.1 SAM-dependent methyltransferase [Phytohabitans sp. ZYX-F-186]